MEMTSKMKHEQQMNLLFVFFYISHEPNRIPSGKYNAGFYHSLVLYISLVQTWIRYSEILTILRLTDIVINKEESAYDHQRIVKN